MEDNRKFNANKLANEEGSWIIGILQSVIGGSGYFYRDTTTLHFFSVHKEIPIYFKNNDVYQPSFTSQMINISMTLNWRTHGNTGKLFIIKMSSTDLRRRVRVGQKNDLSLHNTTL